MRRVDGDTVEWCLLLAETPAQTQRGLMEVTDPELGGYDGMLFRFEEEHEGGFYMRNTPLPLDIAYLDDGGDVVSITTMAPCEDTDGCPTYPADGPFRRTVEVPVAAAGWIGAGDRPTTTGVDSSTPPAPAPPDGSCATPPPYGARMGRATVDCPPAGIPGSITRSNRHPAPDRPGPRHRRVHREERTR